MTIDDQRVRRVLRKWSEAGVRPRPGAPQAALDAFVARYAVGLPASFSRLYAAADGMDAADVDAAHVRFWALSEVRPLADEPGMAECASGDQYFLFADWSWGAHAYAVRCDAPGKRDLGSHVVSVGGYDLAEVAPSFDEFIRLYLDDTQRLFR